LKYSSLVFSGRATTVNAREGSVRFEVNRVWKGAVRRQFLMLVRSQEDYWSAEFFKEGTSYLVFARAISTIEAVADPTPSIPAGMPIVQVSMCGWTGPVEEAHDWIKQLGAGKSPR
jgi:hypothetical protein